MVYLHVVEARGAGADDAHVETEQHDLRAPGVGGEEIFIETAITATAIGRPDLARIARESGAT